MVRPPGVVGNADIDIIEGTLPDMLSVMSRSRRLQVNTLGE
jgi:hypothetical protein